ncbi:MAG: phosphate signaling complex protein PhoU [Aggregatilineales bacterium]
MNTNRSTFDRQLGMLRDEVVQVSDVVEQSITLSVKALQEHDLGLARHLDEADSQVNARRFATEEHAYQLLALQQPNSKDMRLIVALVTIVTNLERIGDHAAGIARLAIRLGEHPLLDAPPMFGEMAVIGQWLTRNAMTAFVTCDEALARTVSARDAEIDELHRQAYRHLIDTMTQNPATVEAGTLMLWVSHNLERIGDRASNIATRVPYLVKGELVRHPDAMP